MPSWTGHKINGRRIGVRDADSDDKKSKRGKRKDPEGLKLYVGNLPFKATEEQLKAIFEGVATVNELVMATDNAGKPKGFAFAFVKETDQGEAIVAKLNGTELLRPQRSRSMSRRAARRAAKVENLQPIRR